MYGVCLRYAGNTEDAKDVLQEGFLRVFEKIGQFGFKGAFEGWIRKIMVNIALEKYRMPLHLLNAGDLPEQDTQDDLADAGSGIDIHVLLDYIQQLSPQYRIVFNLYVIDGYSHREISEMLDISEGTSKSNLSRARSILKDKVNRYYLKSI